jgi:exodeoxyribonuclease V alpha subunit
VTAIEPDRFDVRRVLRAPSALLREFNEAGVLAAADVHVAARLCALSEERDEAVALAAAFAVRAPRLGHVHVDLATIRDTATVDTDEPVDLSTLPWPERWVERVAACGLVGGPLQLEGSRLYLDRYWREERAVAADLLALSREGADGVDVDVLAEGVDRLFDGSVDHVRVHEGPAEGSGRLFAEGGDADDVLGAGLDRPPAGDTDGRQRLAAAAAVLRRLAVVAGGPGTGKTTTVARIVALLAEQAAASGSTPPLVALAAPTGKAAARLEEAVHAEAASLPVSDAVREQLLSLRASTLHRLLGWRPDSHSRFRHNRGQRLPHDVVIVDETSMVSLSLTARLIEAIRPDARLVLVGDPGQLASIEAGAVLGDVVGPARDGLRISAPARTLLKRATGHDIEADDPPPGTAIGDGIVVLDRVHRFGEGIARLAEAIARGDADAVIEVLETGPSGVSWIPVDVADIASESALTPIRDRALASARSVSEAALAGDARAAIDALAAFRLLCAHRRGPHGVASWTTRIESWLGTAADLPWYAGRPLLVTQNDYELQLYNGDTGVVVQSDADRLTAAFERRGEIVEFSPTRLSAVETVYAMTIHKSQGSQFATAAVLLPPSSSRILTRELLYTAATRARSQLILAGTERAIRAAVGRPVARASGLRGRLWADAALSRRA